MVGMVKIFGYSLAEITAGMNALIAPDESPPIPSNGLGTSDKQSLRVPHLSYCPECGTGLTPVAAKGVCYNPGCSLYRAIIENCCGD